VGVILLAERLARELASEVDAARREGRLPLILEIADLAGPLPEGPSLSARLRKIIGVAK
jgi:vacuolar-type H+-ATPase subunit F/Vma7